VFEPTVTSVATIRTPAKGRNVYRGAKLLACLRTVLKVGGLLLLPAENLLAPRILIASIQDLLTARPIFRRGYRGYLATLRASGFRHISAYSVAPSYDYPLYVVSCRYRASRRFFVMEASSPGNTTLSYLVKSGLGVVGVAPYIQHSFLFVCRK
jgi:hypothetical protein